MIPYMIGQCVNDGQQAMVKNPNGRIVGPLTGSKAIWLVCTGPAGSPFEGVTSRVGPAPLCPECAVDSITPAELKQSLSESSLAFIPKDMNEFKYLTDLSIELYAQY